MSKRSVCVIRKTTLPLNQFCTEDVLKQRKGVPPKKIIHVCELKYLGQHPYHMLQRHCVGFFLCAIAVAVWEGPTTWLLKQFCTGIIFERTNGQRWRQRCDRQDGELAGVICFFLVRRGSVNVCCLAVTILSDCKVFPVIHVFFYFPAARSEEPREKATLKVTCHDADASCEAAEKTKQSYWPVWLSWIRVLPLQQL